MMEPVFLFYFQLLYISLRYSSTSFDLDRALALWHVLQSARLCPSTTSNFRTLPKEILKKIS